MSTTNATMNEYKDIARYYDLLMDGGYYDHHSLAKVIRSTIGDRKRLLELGTGTGRLAQELLELDPSYEFTGVDFSPAMLERARQRVPDDVALIEADVTDMKLDETFDVALSSGGTWVMIRDGDELMLGTHLVDRDSDVQGLRNVAEHLEDDGLLLLSVQDAHADRDIPLKDGIVYSQRIEGTNGPSDHFFLEKEYSFHKNGKVLAEEKLKLGFYKDPAYSEMLAQAGFAPVGLTDDGKFYVYETAK